MKWKKWCTLGLICIAATMLLAGCGSSSKSGQKPIVIGLDDNFPPMGFRNSQGELEGFDIDLAREVAKKLNRPVEFKPIDWNAKEAELDSGRIDAIWNGLSITPEREKQILFSEPYMKDEQIVVVLKDSDIHTLADLKGKIIGVQNGSTALDALKKDTEVYNGAKEVKLYPDNVAALMDEREKRVDAVVVDSVVGRYYLKSKEGTYRILAQNLGREDFAVGFKKGNTQLQGEVNTALNELRKDGVLKQLSEKWFGADITE